MSVNEKSEFKMNKIKGVLKVGVFVLVLSFFSACTILYETRSNPFPFYYIPHFLQPSYYQAKRIGGLINKLLFMQTNLRLKPKKMLKKLNFLFIGIQIQDIMLQEDLL